VPIGSQTIFLTPTGLYACFTHFQHHQHSAPSTDERGSDPDHSLFTQLQFTGKKRRHEINARIKARLAEILHVSRSLIHCFVVCPKIIGN